MAAVRRWWRRPDHYYWLTALLAARGAQAITCRLIAVVTAGCGVLSLVLLTSPSGPQGRRDVIIAVGVAVVCLALAGMWLRLRWPQRAAATGFALTASLCVALVCLVQSQPLVGIVVANSFAVVAGYIALFRTARVMAVNTTITITTLVVLAIRQAALGDVVLAGTTAALVLFVYLMLPFICHAMVRLLGANTPNQEIDQLTGLANRQAFYRQTAELVSARARVDDRYLVILLLSLDSFSLLIGTEGQGAGDRAHIAVAQTLRETTRGDAVVAHSAPAEFLIADTFSTDDPTPLIERVRGAIATTPPRLTVSIGVVCTPLRALADLPPERVLDELIATAGIAMAEARAAGGNQARQVDVDAPRVEDPAPDDADDSW